MSYKIVKYKKKNKCPFETYEPEKRASIRKEQALPFLIRISHLGGVIGFWVSSFLVAVKGFFGIKKKAESFSFNRKVAELRIKKRN
jgi:hypothetical protein